MALSDSSKGNFDSGAGSGGVPPRGDSPVTTGPAGDETRPIAELLSALIDPDMKSDDPGVFGNPDAVLSDSSREGGKQESGADIAPSTYPSARTDQVAAVGSARLQSASSAEAFSRGSEIERRSEPLGGVANPLDLQANGGVEGIIIEDANTPLGTGYSGDLDKGEKNGNAQNDEPEVELDPDELLKSLYSVLSGDVDVEYKPEKSKDYAAKARESTQQIRDMMAGGPVQNKLPDIPEGRVTPEGVGDLPVEPEERTLDDVLRDSIGSEGASAGSSKMFAGDAKIRKGTAPNPALVGDLAPPVINDDEEFPGLKDYQANPDNQGVTEEETRRELEDMRKAADGEMKAYCDETATTFHKTALQSARDKLGNVGLQKVAEKYTQGLSQGQVEALRNGHENACMDFYRGFLSNQRFFGLRYDNPGLPFPPQALSEDIGLSSAGYMKALLGGDRADPNLLAVVFTPEIYAMLCDIGARVSEGALNEAGVSAMISEIAPEAAKFEKLNDKLALLVLDYAVGLTPRYLPLDSVALHPLGSFKLLSLMESATPGAIDRFNLGACLSGYGQYFAVQSLDASYGCVKVADASVKAAFEVNEVLDVISGIVSVPQSPDTGSTGTGALFDTFLGLMKFLGIKTGEMNLGVADGSSMLPLLTQVNMAYELYRREVKDWGSRDYLLGLIESARGMHADMHAELSGSGDTLKLPEGSDPALDIAPLSAAMDYYSAWSMEKASLRVSSGVTDGLFVEINGVRNDTEVLLDEMKQAISNVLAQNQDRVQGLSRKTFGKIDLNLDQKNVSEGVSDEVLFVLSKMQERIQLLEKRFAEASASVADEANRLANEALEQEARDLREMEKEGRLRDKDDLYRDEEVRSLPYTERLTPSEQSVERREVADLAPVPGQTSGKDLGVQAQESPEQRVRRNAAKVGLVKFGGSYESPDSGIVSVHPIYGPGSELNQSNDPSMLASAGLAPLSDNAFDRSSLDAVSAGTLQPGEKAPEARLGSASVRFTGTGRDGGVETGVKSEDLDKDQEEDKGASVSF